ncbi:MAG TPA: hypothetical protein DCZ92_14000 [Elusimicrobia bacterium]|nr:MAG: hypothetical protein A2016_05430 [Elusimicrobia bacterium GWF2_62_30]HBA61894.1 hypothetical protein [Elusimicrobiota bacterium]
MEPGNPKKNSPAAAGLLACLCCLAPAARAAQPGQTVASFLKFDPSPRGSAMGEANAATTQDAYAAWCNPAGLAALEVPELAAAQETSLAEVSNQYASFAYPLNYGSTLGVSITRQSMAAFQGYDAMGGYTRLLEASATSIAASYARTLLKDEVEHPVLSAGVSVKSISEKLDSASGSALAMDLGVIYHLRPSKYWMKNTPAQELRVGLAVKNLGSDVTFDKTSFPLPQAKVLGLAWISHPSGAHTLTVSLDQTLSNYAKYGYSAGAEYFMFQLISLRAGYISARDTGTGVCLGVGFRLSFMDLDYSMSPFGELGTTQKLGATLRFGTARSKQPLAGATARVARAGVMAPKEKIEALKLYANDYIELARRNLDGREYTLAVDNLNKAFNLEPRLIDGPWGNKSVRLEALNKRLQLRDTPVREKNFQKREEQSNVAHEAVVAYIEGHEMKAFLLAHAALGANRRGDALFEELLYNLADLTRNGVRRDEIMPKMVLIKEKLKKAAKGFYIQQFDLAARECEEVVLLDETNPIGWTRLGSAYYMMGDKAKARKAYEKALQLNPGDAVTRKFMDEQGWKPGPPPGQ